MLVLSRKQGQTVVIDGRIRVTVQNIRGNVVRIGFEAPREVSILREELEVRRNNVSSFVAYSGSCGQNVDQLAESGALI